MQNKVTAAFQSPPIGQGYCLWLAFIALLQSDHWHEQAKQDAHLPFNLWLHNHIKPVNLLWLQAPQVVGFLLGTVSMLGALTYSGVKPVNIWLILGLFCALPLITIIISGWQTLKNRSTTPRFWGGQSLHAFLIKRLGITSSLPPSPTAVPWLLWRTQLAGASFHLGAILTFALILLFNDIAFGWSSTLIKDPASIHGFFEAISTPWQKLIEPPSLELIEQTQFFYSQGISNTINHQWWWPHLLFAMFFYGLVPRLLLCAWLKHRSTKRFYLELTNSIHIQRFLHAQNQSASQNAKTTTPSEQPLSTPSNPSIQIPAKATVLAWQRHLTIPGISSKTLGTQSWQCDEQWINQQHFNGPVFIVVHAEQTPTAELSDLLALIHTPQQLLLISTGPKSTQLKSWQYFANEHSIPIQITTQIKPTEHAL